MTIEEHWHTLRGVRWFCTVERGDDAANSTVERVDDAAPSTTAQAPSSPPAAAVDIVLIHGFQNDHTTWTPWTRLLPALTAGGARTIAVDLPGCGRSGIPETWERAAISELATDIAEIIELEHLDRPVLIGHSLGGAISLVVALDHPDLVGGIVLFAPASTRGLDFVSAEDFEALAAPTPEDQRRLLRAAFHRRPDDATMAAMEAIIEGAHPLHIEGAARSMREFVVEDRLGSITAPALLIAGDRDRHVPLRNHVATWAALPRAGLHVEHGVGHVPFVEAPAETAAVVTSFLDEILSKRSRSA